MPIAESVRSGDGDATPGAWAARLRFTVREPIVTKVRWECGGGYQLFLDGEPIGHSTSDLVPGEASYDVFEFDLAPGRHELFAHLWSLERDGIAPTFNLAGEGSRDLFDTGRAAWVAGRIPNIAFPQPYVARVIVDGEPAGSWGMDRGVEWAPVVVESELGPAPLRVSTDLLPLSPREVTDLEIEGEGTGEAFRSVLGPEGAFLMAAEERAVISFELPQEPLYVRLRASGGGTSLIRIWSGEDLLDSDVFLPKGFRQDFASFAALAGGMTTMHVEGGERGTALFRLEFFREVSG